MRLQSITNTIRTAGMDRTLNVRRDLPDTRDRMYEPALIPLNSEVDNRGHVPIILDQETEGSCTGQGLAAVINLLNNRKRTNFIVSQRMLYEMAQKHDEWPGEDYEGSSCRGAIRGWKNMGVCSEEAWPYVGHSPDYLTIPRAIAARENTLGAYYRLRPEIVDYHAALNEVGAIYVSAGVHEGWVDPLLGADALAEINPGGASIGGHAFAIVGYTQRGFIVQNSWGSIWGTGGFALWLYKDWIDTVSDGWVFRLALPTPEIFGLRVQSAVSGDAEAHRQPPRRLEIAGHFVHYDNGSYKDPGKYWSTPEDIEQTARLVAKTVNNEDGGYRHLLIYAHGGLNAPPASARRIAALKDGFKRNGIYPFHIMYDTGLAKETTDAVKRALGLSEQRSRGFVDWIGEKISDVTDKMIEDIIRKPGTAIWDEMKSDARWPFERKNDDRDDDGMRKIEYENDDMNGDGMHTIMSFVESFAGTNLKIHIACHSTGAILTGHLLQALDSLGQSDLVSSCSLMAPACSVDFYNKHFAPRMTDSTDHSIVKLPKLNIYNLTDDLERDDHVALAYRKSLLYLVSRSFERDVDKPLLGMQRYSGEVIGPEFFYSDGKNGVTRSKSHGGFDNDTYTLNHILKTILGDEPVLEPFTEDEMEGY